MLDSIGAHGHEMNSDKSFIDLFESYADEETDESPYKPLSINCDYVDSSTFNNCIPKNSKTFSCFHLNCRGLSANWDDFKELIMSLHCDYFKFDIIGVSECYNHSNDERIHIDGYHDILSRNRTEGRRGGVGLFIKEHIKYKVHEEYSVFIPHVFESIFVEIETNSRNRELIGIIYRPNTPPLADIDIFHEHMAEVMDQINKHKFHATIMGDINIDLMKYGSHEKTNVYVDMLFENGFLPLITKPTRIGTTSATLIDHIYSNNFKGTPTSGIVINDVADHYGVFVINTFSKGNVTSIGDISTERRKINDRNVNLFLETLSNCNFSDIMNNKSAEDSYDLFLHRFKAVFDLSFPMVKAPTTKKRNSEPWYTDELKTCNKKRKKLLKQKHKSPSEQSFSKYKECNNTHN